MVDVLDNEDQGDGFIRDYLVERSLIRLLHLISVKAPSNLIQYEANHFVKVYRLRYEF